MGLGTGVDLLQLGFTGDVVFQQILPKQRKWIPQQVPFQIIAVPFFADARSMVVQQRHFGVYQKRPTLSAHQGNDFPQGFITGKKIVPMNAAGFQTFETCRVFRCTLGPHFGGTGGNIPAIVLYQIKNRQFFQYRHLHGFRNFPFGHRSIAKRAHHDGFFKRIIFGQGPGFAVPKAQGYASGGYGLHARCRRLMWDFGFVRIFQTWMRIISTSSREGIVAFG